MGPMILRASEQDEHQEDERDESGRSAARALRSCHAMCGGTRPTSTLQPSRGGTGSRLKMNRNTLIETK